MKHFDIILRSFFDINKKEDVTPTMFPVTEAEITMISSVLEKDVNKEAVFWHDGNLIKSSGIRPKEYCIWNDETKQWIVDNQAKSDYLARARNEVWEQIKIIRSKHQSTGVRVGDKWFHTDQEALMNYAIYNITINYPETEPSQWKTMDGSYVLMTPELFKSVMLLISKKGNDDFKNAEIHRMKLWQSDDPYSYDYSTGWSEGYNT